MSKRKATKLEVTVTLTFKQDQIRSLCDAIHFGDEDRGKALFDKLRADPDYFGEFAEALRGSNDSFVDEIIDTAEDSCANDWLSEFAIEEDEEEE